MSCLHYCCYCCCYCCDQCCPHVGKQKPDKLLKFPHIEYRSPDQANKSASSLEKVPLERQYVFAQPPSELPFHHPPSSAVMTVVPVTEQPRRQTRSYTPCVSPHSVSLPVWRHSTPTPEPSSDIVSMISDSGTISSELQSVADSHPTLQFSIYYDIQHRVLAVHIQQAYNLPIVMKGPTTTPCNPFILLFLLPNREKVFESRTIQRDVNPSFNQIFDFPGLQPEDIRKQTLIMKVFHSRKTKNELIGMISLPLEDADLYGVSVKMSINEKVEHFSSECRGQVLFSVTHRPDSRSLHGIILRAKNLQKVNGTGTAYPYIKVYMLVNGKRHNKWRSSVKRSTLMPIFNESFRFEIPSAVDLHGVGLELILMNHNRFSGDEVMGVVRIGENAPEETGRSHWSEVLRTPNHAVSRWHSAWPATHVYDGSSDRESIVTN